MVTHMGNKEDLIKKKDELEKLRINMNFLGLDLSKVPTQSLNDFRVYIIPVLYVASSFISIKLTTTMQSKAKNKKEEDENRNNLDKNARSTTSLGAIKVCVQEISNFFTNLDDKV